MSLLKRALKTTVLLVVAILIGWGVQQWIYQSTADAIGCVELVDSIPCVINRAPAQCAQQIAASCAYIKRIAVIGNAGSGKSTLADDLHKILQLPEYHLDQYCWQAGWVRTDDAECKAAHDALCDRNEWIIEGLLNFSLWKHRMDHAEMIVIISMGRLACLWRIIKRVILYYGVEMPASPADCPGKIDRSFFELLKWSWNFAPVYQAHVADLIKTYGATKKIYVLDSQASIDVFIEAVARRTIR